MRALFSIAFVLSCLYGAAWLDFHPPTIKLTAIARNQ